MPASEFRGRLARMLVRVLLVDRGSVVSRAALIDALWGEDTPADADANLNVIANRARRALGDPSLIVTREGGYTLSRGPRCSVDAETFLDHLAEGRRCIAAGQPAAALRELETGLALWGEPLPEDAYADWAQPFRARMERAHEETLTHATEAALAIHDSGRARALATELAAAHPLSEPAQLLLVRSLADAGDVAGALDAFTRWRTRLADELGLDPSSEATELHLRLLRGEPLPPRGRRAVSAQPARPDEELAFVGRDRELRAVVAAVDAPRSGCIIVRGRSGSGKSRLLAEAALRVSGPVLPARPFRADREQPWGLARGLLRHVIALEPDATAGLPRRVVDALGDILPEVSDEPAGPVHGETRRALATEGGLRLLERVAAQGAVVICDDLQWADASSLQLVSAARSRLPRLSLVLACRPADLAANPAAAALLGEVAASERTTTIELPPLDAGAIGALVDDPQIVAVLAADTDATPMAVGEVIRALERVGWLRRTGGGRWRTVRSGARDAARAAAEAGKRRAIALRVSQQPTGPRLVLGLLALLSRAAPPPLLAAAAGTPERDTLDHLDALEAADLARVSDHGWATAHDVIAETVADHLADGERARLHGQLAEALERAGGDPGEVARHRAGAGDADGAAAGYAAAAADRLARCATAEAADLADAGLALPATAIARSSLLCSRAEARAARGDLVGAADDLRRALDAAASGSDRARILSRMTLLAAAEEDLGRARELADTALVAAASDPSARAAALSAAAVVDMNIGRPADADQRTAEAQRLYTELGDTHGLARIVDDRAMATFLAGSIHDAVIAFDRAARLLVDAGDLLRVMTPRSTRGHALVFAGDPAAGLADTEAALELALELGYPEGEAYARWHRSEAFAALGHPEEALSDAERALALARDIGHRGWTAMALRARGIARRAAEDDEGAATDLASCLELGEGVPLFTSWACAQLASVCVRRGELERAAELVERALATGPPLAGYEARLAEAELAAARGDDAAVDVAGRALAAARAGGHLASAARLELLQAGAPSSPSGPARSTVT